MRSARGASLVEYLVTVGLVVVVLAGAAALYGRSFVASAACAGIRIGVLDRANGAACAGAAPKLVAAASAPVPGGDLPAERELICDNMHCFPPEQEACFAAGTEVRTPTGTTSIERLAVGDLVLAVDPREPEARIVPRKVVGTKVTEDRETLALALQGERGGADVLVVTPEHPFFELSRPDGPGWSAAGTLRDGARVRTAAGEAVVLGALPLEGHGTVYNLEVATAHTYFVGAVGALVHNSYDPEEEWMRTELALPGRAKKTSTTEAEALGKLARGTLAKDQALTLPKAPAAATAPEKTQLAGLEAKAAEAYSDLVAARKEGRAVELAAGRYRSAVAAYLTAVDTLRGGARLVEPAIARKKLSRSRGSAEAATPLEHPSFPTASRVGKLSPSERAELVKKLLTALKSAQAGEGTPNAALVAMRVALPADDYAALEKASRELTASPASIKNFEDALVRAERALPEDPQIRAMLGGTLTRYRRSALEQLERSGGDPKTVAEAASRARYLDAKRILEDPDKHAPEVVGDAKDVVAAYEGKPPTFERFKAARGVVEEAVRDVDRQLAKYGGKGEGGEASTTAARLVAEKKRLLEKRSALERENERDVVAAAKARAAAEMDARAATIAELEKTRSATTDAEARRAIEQRIVEEKKAQASAEVRLVAEAKADLAKTNTSPLRVKADAMWSDLKAWRAKADAEGRTRALTQLSAELERAEKRVTDLKFEVDHYEHEWKRDGKVVTKRLVDGKVVSKEAIQNELTKATLERDTLALKAARMRRDLAQIERDDAAAWKAFREAEWKAQEAELRLAQVGRPAPARTTPSLPDSLPAKDAAVVREYLKRIGKPMPGATQVEEDPLVGPKAELEKAKRLAKDAADAIAGREKRLTDADAALATAKAKLDESKVKDALSALSPPPPAPREDIHGGTPLTGPPKPVAPKVTRNGPTEAPPTKVTFDSELFWKDLNATLEATNQVPPALRPAVSKLAKGVVDIAEAIEKWHDDMSADELKKLDAEVAEMKKLRDQLRAQGVDVDRPALKAIFDVVDVLAETRKQFGHFRVGFREEFVKLVTGLVGLTGKLVRFQNDREYRDEVKATMDKLAEMAGEADGNKVMRLALREAKNDFDRDPARALGRIAGFIATFFIPFEKGFEAFATLGKSGARLGELAADASRAGKLGTEAAGVARDLSVAARALEDVAAAGRGLGREIEVLVAEARALRLLGKEGEALSKLAAANARIEALRTVTSAMKDWEATAKKAVDALRLAKADAEILANAEADLARAQAGLKQLTAAETAAADAGKLSEAEAALAKARNALEKAAKGGKAGKTWKAPDAKKLAEWKETLEQIEAKREIARRLQRSIWAERQNAAAAEGARAKPAKKGLPEFNQSTRNGMTVAETEAQIAKLEGEAAEMQAEILAELRKGVETMDPATVKEAVVLAKEFKVETQMAEEARRVLGAQWRELDAGTRKLMSGTFQELAAASGLKLADVELAAAELERAAAEASKGVDFTKTLFVRHGDKHLKAKTAEEALAMSAKPGKPSQYLPEFRNDAARAALETEGLKDGLMVVHSKSTNYYYHDTGKIVGYDGGEATSWIRVEITNGTEVHSHAVTFENIPPAVRKLLKKKG